MRLRHLLGIGAALAIATGVAPAAHAEEPTYEANVGGGAAGAVVGADVQSYLLREPLDKDRVTFDSSTPYVTMGRDGGNARRRVLDQRVGPTKVKVAEVSILGNRFGTPYAEGYTKLTDVAGVTGAVKGTTLFKSIETYCRWDRTGWVASTQITLPDGTVHEPAPNTVLEIPGVGAVTVNEQYVRSRPVRIDGVWVWEETVFVLGVHLHADQDANDLPPVNLGDIYVEPSLSVEADVYLGFTSCDPAVLPNLGGLKLTKTAA